MAKTKLVALHRIAHNDRTYMEGDEIEVEATEAAALKRSGSAAESGHDDAKRASRARSKREGTDDEGAPKPEVERFPANPNALATGEAFDHLVVRNGQTVGDVSISRSALDAEARDRGESSEKPADEPTTAVKTRKR